MGIAPGSEFSGQELGELGEVFGEVKSIVVLAQRITDPIQVVRFYTGSVYRGSRVATSFADAMLKSTCWQVVEVLRQTGVRAAAPRNLRYGEAAPRHSLSFKKAAVLAGLGAFGRNQLVIHPKWGPWMMLRTVVTDAPLPPDEQVDFSPCDGCGQCIEACPSGALSDNGIERDVCDQVVGYRGPDSATVMRPSAHGQINCEECLRACPIGEAPPRLQLGEM